MANESSVSAGGGDFHLGFEAREAKFFARAMFNDRTTIEFQCLKPEPF